WARITLGALVLHLVLRSRGLRVPTDPVMLRHFATVTLFGNIIPFSLLAWGEQHITSALTAVLNASTPLFTALFAAIALRARLRPVQIAGLVVGVVGVAVAAGVGGARLPRPSPGRSGGPRTAGPRHGRGFWVTRRPA